MAPALSAASPLGLATAQACWEAIAMSGGSTRAAGWPVDFDFLRINGSEWRVANAGGTNIVWCSLGLWL